MANPQKLSELVLDNANALSKISIGGGPAPEREDPFWFHTEQILVQNWDQKFPYQLILVKRGEDGNYASVPGWTFTLPMPPESLAISMPFAITTAATLGGIIEEHNGSPFRLLQLTGTTGILPDRGTAKLLTTASFVSSVFAGTIRAAQTGIVRPAHDLSRDLSNEPLTPPNLMLNEVSSKTDAGKTSGYYQFRLLQCYLENYVALKKKVAGRPYRLAFAIWKDEAVYLVTPQSFDVRRNPQSPFEYPYSLAFKAWRRIKLDSTVAPLLASFAPITRDPNKLARALKAIEDARRVLQGVRNTMVAFGGDVVHTVFEPLRELALLLKDLEGVPLGIVDMSNTVMQGAKDAIVELVATKDFNEIFGNNLDAAGNSLNVKEQYEELRKFAVETEKAQSGGGDVNRGASSQPLSSGAKSHRANKVFEDPDRYFDFFSGIRVSQLKLSPFTLRSIETEQNRVRNFTRLDFEKRRDAVAQAAALFANNVGAGNDRFNEVYGLAAVPSPGKPKVPTDDDFEAMYALNQVVMELNRFAAFTEAQHQITSLDYIAGLASASGIAFTKPQSKFAVPFPYGSTLEQVSTTYLKTPNRWHEIAALNGLRPPYVDEEGFDLLLLVNGKNNQVVIQDSTRLYVGQQVWLSSPITTRTRRRITKIEVLSTTQSVITVDGDPDLDRFTVLAEAALHAFLPDTVNSMMSIYIPSQELAVGDSFTTKPIPGIDEFDPLINVAGVDLLVTPSGDLALTVDGDCRFAIGLTNIIQKVRTALSVRRGQLNQHPDYGIPITPGQSIADLSQSELLNAAQNMFTGDPAFAGVVATGLTTDGGLTKLGIAVQIAGTSQVIPVTADVKR